MMRVESKRGVSVLILFLFVPLILFTNTKPQGEEKVLYTVIERGDTAALETSDPKITVFHEQQDFRAHYSAIHRNKVPQPQPPQVNFGEDLVLLISFGQQPTAGYSIDLLNIYTKESKSRDPLLIVEAVLIKPPADRIQAQMITNPYLLVSIPKEYYSRVDLRLSGSGLDM